MKILILTTDQELALLRQRVLEDAGHEVTPKVTEKDVLEAADKNVPFDVALVCHHLPTPPRERSSASFTTANVRARSIFISHIYGEWPEVEADRYVVGADGPDALIKIVAESGPQASPTPI